MGGFVNSVCFSKEQNPTVEDESWVGMLFRHTSREGWAAFTPKVFLWEIPIISLFRFQTIVLVICNQEFHATIIWMIGLTSRVYMDVSKNRGTPKWMVYNGKPY